MFLLELIAVSRKVGVQVKVKLCQRVLDGLELTAEWV